MKKIELQKKLTEIHTHLTRLLSNPDIKGLCFDVLEEAEEKLNNLENQIAREP